MAIDHGVPTTNAHRSGFGDRRPGSTPPGAPNEATEHRLDVS
jgi:hypothetical protein